MSRHPVSAALAAGVLFLALPARADDLASALSELDRLQAGLNVGQRLTQHEADKDPCVVTVRTARDAEYVFDLATVTLAASFAAPGEDRHTLALACRTERCFAYTVEGATTRITSPSFSLPLTIAGSVETTKVKALLATLAAQCKLGTTLTQ